MAACGSLRTLFENPLPENPSLIESLSTWNQIKNINPLDDSSFTEIFGELHFKEKPEPVPANPPPLPPPPPPPVSPSALDQRRTQCDTRLPEVEEDQDPSMKSLPSEPRINQCMGNPKNSDCFSSLDSLFGAPGNQCKGSPMNNDSSFSPKNLESLQLCTEGLGSESSDDVEDLTNELSRDWSIQRNEVPGAPTKRSPAGSPDRYLKSCSHVRSRSDGGFPPPISCIGSGGRPWVWFRSYRQDGRFVLREIRIPNQECLHASREDGRLKLHFAQPDDDIEEGKEEEGEEEQGGGGGGERIEIGENRICQ